MFLCVGPTNQLDVGVCVIICIFYASSQPTVYQLVIKATLNTRGGGEFSYTVKPDSLNLEYATHIHVKCRIQVKMRIQLTINQEYFGLHAVFAMPCSTPNHTRLKPGKDVPDFLPFSFRVLARFYSMIIPVFERQAKPVLFNSVSKEDVLFVSV
jgi:hypothetical protein